MKYRIIKKTINNVCVLYYPQVKFLFWWFYFEDENFQRVSFSYAISAEEFIENRLNKQKNDVEVVKEYP